MKVLLVSEGPSELGGALRTLVTRLGEVELEIEQDKVSRSDIHAHHGKGRGYFKRAIRWMLEAQRRGFDALILVIDQDEVTKRVKELEDAQRHTATTVIRRALGVAIRKFDAWMLVDERAISNVLDCAISRQPDPEGIKDPKQVCSALLENSDSELNAVEMYAGIMAIVDIAALETRCPRGFMPFAQRVRNL